MLQEDEDEQLIQEITTALFEETNEPSSEMTLFNFPRDLRWFYVLNLCFHFKITILPEERRVNNNFVFLNRI